MDTIKRTAIQNHNLRGEEYTREQPGNFENQLENYFDFV